MINVKGMLQLQADMNAKVNPAWLTAGYPYLRAVVVEGGEALEHHGWKWWKKQEMDQKQLQIELIDILHFYLSDTWIHAGGDINEASAIILGQMSSPYFNDSFLFGGETLYVDQMDALRKIEVLVGLATMRRTNYQLLFSVMKDVGLNEDDVYKQYVGKNVLNFFRQDHGYKDGTYVKIWHGEEDNVHLAKIMAATTDPSEIYGQLSAVYQGVLVNAGDQIQVN